MAPLFDSIWFLSWLLHENDISLFGNLHPWNYSFQGYRFATIPPKSIKVFYSTRKFCNASLISNWKEGICCCVWTPKLNTLSSIPETFYSCQTYSSLTYSCLRWTLLACFWHRSWTVLQSDTKNHPYGASATISEFFKQGNFLFCTFVWCASF